MFLLNSVTKINIFVITVKGLKPTRNQNATTTPARHMWETGSLNWGQFMHQWFIRFSEFTEFNESSAPFRKNSNKLYGDKNSVERSTQIYQRGIFSWSEA